MWKCPKCQSTKLSVLVEVWATLTQPDNLPEDYGTDADNDHEWSENSPMQCRDCFHTAISQEFETGDDNE